MLRRAHRHATFGMKYEGLDAATVSVRWLSVERWVERYIPSWKAVLDGEEITRADRFRFTVDRDTFVAAHTLARTMLGGMMGLHPDSFRYVIGRYGKPAIASCPGGDLIHFSISHTRGLAACAVARHFELGLDVEAMKQWHADFDMVCRLFSPEEAKLINEASPDRRADLFFRLWTLKESFVKATGEGLHRPLNSFSFKLDPVRIDFCPLRANIPGRDNAPGRRDPEQWQFREYRPAPDCLLALSIHRKHAPSVQIDASPILPEEIAIGLNAT
jgi:4'-phosphopantetheinyl transferase